jgi:hypothetical protein
MKRAIGVAAGASIIASTALVQPVEAADFDGDFWWDDEGIYGTSANSNAYGFWEFIMGGMYYDYCANGIHDGFGHVTDDDLAQTKRAQNDLGELPANQQDGIVGPITWKAVQFSTTPVGALRLSSFSAPFYSYYTGTGNAHELYYDSGNTWKWQHPSSGTYYTTEKSSNSVSIALGDCDVGSGY